MHNLFETLRADHDNHRTLMEQIEKTEGAGGDRKVLLRTLRNELESHAAAEERCLYTHMMAEPSSTDVARHGVAEHHDIDKALGALLERDLDDPQWLPTFRKLRHRVEHHLDEEEHGVFQLAGKVLSEDQKISLAAEFQTQKQQELQRRG